MWRTLGDSEEGTKRKAKNEIIGRNATLFIVVDDNVAAAVAVAANKLENVCATNKYSAARVVLSYRICSPQRALARSSAPASPQLFTCLYAGGNLLAF